MSSYRIHFYIAGCGEKIGFIHRKPGKAAFQRYPRQFSRKLIIRLYRLSPHLCRDLTAGKPARKADGAERLASPRQSTLCRQTDESLVKNPSFFAPRPDRRDQTARNIIGRDRKEGGHEDAARQERQENLPPQRRDGAQAIIRKFETTVFHP